MFPNASVSNKAEPSSGRARIKHRKGIAVLFAPPNTFDEQDVLEKTINLIQAMERWVAIRDFEIVR